MTHPIFQPNFNIFFHPILFSVCCRIVPPPQTFPVLARFFFCYQTPLEQTKKFRLRIQLRDPQNSTSKHGPVSPVRQRGTIYLSRIATKALCKLGAVFFLLQKAERYCYYCCLVSCGAVWLCVCFFVQISVTVFWEHKFRVFFVDNFVN